jgi:hypothetical protein
VRNLKSEIGNLRSSEAWLAAPAGTETARDWLPRNQEPGGGVRMAAAQVGESRSGFVLANAAKKAQSRRMNASDDVSDFAAEQGLNEEVALKRCMKGQSKESAEKGAEDCGMV